MFTKEDAGPLPEFVDRVYDATLENITIRLEDVQKKLKHLNVNKSCGTDDMHPRILYELRYIISEPLTDIFQHTISTGSLPDKWKSGQITPIFKKGDKQRAKNYRPVSLTSIPYKINSRAANKGRHLKPSHVQQSIDEVSTRFYQRKIMCYTVTGCSRYLDRDNGQTW